MPEQLLFTAPRQVEVRPYELPPMGPKQVRVRTLFSGISAGTEMNVYRGTAPFYRGRLDRTLRLFVEGEAPEWTYPCPYGYETVGRVEAVGADVRGMAEGDLVFCAVPHRTHHVLDADKAALLPRDAPPDASVLLRMLSITLNGALDTGVKVGETVAVFGQGVAGLLIAQWLKLSGAGQVIGIDPLPQRRALATKIGVADVTLDPTDGDVALAVRRLTDGRGADVTVEVSGSHAALNQAIRVAAYDSTVVVMSWYHGQTVALELGAEYHLNRITLRCSQSGGINPQIAHRWPRDRRERVALQYLSRFPLSELISHRVPFAEAPAAYRLIDERPAEAAQVVLTY